MSAISYGKATDQQGPLHPQGPSEATIEAYRRREAKRAAARESQLTGGSMSFAKDDRVGIAGYKASGTVLGTNDEGFYIVRIDGRDRSLLFRSGSLSPIQWS